jgi:hypothetical protein
MDENLRHQRDTSLGQLETLIRRGRELRNTRAIDATRAWQQECAAAINQLSGGSKAHWLARAYSGAFLVRSGDGGVVVEADSTEIADRILDVLAQGATSLSRMDDVAAASSGAAPRPRQFEFVHNAALRPVLERAFADSRDAFARGDFGLALILSCGVIDAVLTDALAAGSGQQAAAAAAGSRQWAAAAAAPNQQQPAASSRLPASRSASPRRNARDSFVAVAPTAARGSAVPDLTDADGELRAEAVVSEREAGSAGQVLRVVMRDLDPGR